MPRKKYLIGIDIGTSGAKALAIDPRGGLAGEGMTEYPMHTPEPLWAEQDPDDWWKATVKSVSTATAKAGIRGDDIAAVGLTGQMHGLVLLDSHGEVIRPCIMWNDQRSAPQCEQITRKAGLRRLLQMSGNPVLPGFTAPKIQWVRENEPKNYKRISKFLLPKDYVRYRLSGKFYSDVSDASGTSLLDVKNRRWSPQMCELFKIPHTWLPGLSESPVASTAVHRAASHDTGIPAGTPIAGGAGDQAAQAVGAGIVREGLACTTIGTSGVVFAPVGSYRHEPRGRLHAFCHAVPGMWHMMGVMLAAGGSLRWHRDALCREEKDAAAALGSDPYDLMLKNAAKAPAGSGGLVFLPYLSGERTPYADPDARGVFFGLSLQHTKAHMTRAVVEGVTFGLRDTLELMRGLKMKINRMTVSGGGARSALWRQIVADIFAMEVAGAPTTTHGAAYGAALLAGVSAGLYRSVQDACAKTVRYEGATRPGSDAAAYEKYYQVYRSLYPALRQEFGALARAGK